MSFSSYSNSLFFRLFFCFFLSLCFLSISATLALFQFGFAILTFFVLQLFLSESMCVCMRGVVNWKQALSFSGWGKMSESVFFFNPSKIEWQKLLNFSFLLFAYYKLAMHENNNCSRTIRNINSHYICTRRYLERAQITKICITTLPKTHIDLNSQTN